MQSLKERINNYQDLANIKLLPKLPIIVSLNGRGFSKLTSQLQKPFDKTFVDVMGATMIKLAHEVDGCVFVYSFNDEIVLILKNDFSIDTETWYNNQVQKIISAASSIASIHFNKIATSLNLQLISDAIFVGQCFAVPNITEAINTLIYKQNQSLYSSISSACFYELTNKYSSSIVKSKLLNKTIEDKIEILKNDCGIDFFKFYSKSFTNGICCYRAPKLISNSSADFFKNKWTIDIDTPILSNNQDWIYSILTSNGDIFRAERDV